LSDGVAPTHLLLLPGAGLVGLGRGIVLEKLGAPLLISHLGLGRLLELGRLLPLLRLELLLPLLLQPPPLLLGEPLLGDNATM
jgi:hypothetical protein